MDLDLRSGASSASTTLLGPSSVVRHSSHQKLRIEVKELRNFAIFTGGAGGEAPHVQLRFGTGEPHACQWMRRGWTCTAAVRRGSLPAPVQLRGVRRVGTMAEQQEPVDAEYPGTAVRRMHAAMERARSLTLDELSDTWPEVRRRVLWAAGLRDIEDAAPGRGYTGHSFNDWNHCDATTMVRLPPFRRTSLFSRNCS